MTTENKAEQTIERLRKASEMGIKVSAVYNTAKVSAFRVKALLAGSPYYTNNSSKTGKPLTDEEADAINRVLDEIKSAI